jgi:hypothetical protein
MDERLQVCENGAIPAEPSDDAVDPKTPAPLEGTNHRIGSGTPQPP